MWQAIHQALLSWRGWTGSTGRALVDSSSVWAVGAGQATGPSPVDGSKPGSKCHGFTSGRGTPLAIGLTGAERNDTAQCLPLLDRVPP